MKAMFYVSCVIPAEHLHPALAYLERFKIANVEVRTVTGSGEDVVANERAATSTRQLVLDVLTAAGGPISTAAIKEAFTKVGFKPSSSSAILHTLKKEKLIKSAGKATYEITTKGKFGPTVEEVSPAKTNGHAPIVAPDGLSKVQSIIFDVVSSAGGEIVHVKKIRAALAKQKLSPLSANDALTKMVELQLIARASIGKYVIGNAALAAS